MISLKRYYKSMNEQLYNGLGIGLGCNRDTTNLSGIEKTYCESNDEPCAVTHLDVVFKRRRTIG